MEQYIIISIIGIIILAGLSAIVYFFGMKYVKSSESSSNSPCSNDNDCTGGEYCSRGKCKLKFDCLDENGNRCSTCNRLSFFGEETCCSKYKMLKNPDTSNFTSYCVDLEGDVRCDHNEQCKSGQCRNGRCTAPRLTASPCSGDYDCMSGICGKEGRCH